MAMRRWSRATALLVLGGVGSILLQGGIQTTENRAVSEFPGAIRFSLAVSSPFRIDDVELEFGTNARACGTTRNRAFPEAFEPSTEVHTEWLWDLRRTGAMPPGTSVWWQWKIHDESGSTLTTPSQEVVFEDESFAWQVSSSADIDLHWYEGPSTFARSLASAGEEALRALERTTGLHAETRVRVYVYASSEAMRSATLFAPDWSGGLAFPAYSAILIGIPTDSLEWGTRALAHELSHVVMGAFTFSCVDSTPTWLDEGLAMYIEGDLEPYYISLLEDAIRTDGLLSVRSLGELFSENSNLASLAYAESYSLVQFLVSSYGEERMLGLLERFRAGDPEDQALTDVLGFDRDGLEARWRSSIGAPPMQTTPIAVEPTSTPYPTFAPITGPAQAATTTPIEALSASPSRQPADAPAATEPGAGSNPTPEAVFAAGITVLALVLVVAGGTLVARRRRRKG